MLIPQVFIYHYLFCFQATFETLRCYHNFSNVLNPSNKEIPCWNISDVGVKLFTWYIIYIFYFFFRIRWETNGGAWCPSQPVSSDTYEFLQVDLGRLKVVTLVETQGRFGNGQVGLL